MTCAKRAGIIGVGSAVPETVLTNSDLEKMVDTSDEWIRTMTGVVERRIADEDKATSDYAAEAARKALERANVKPEELDLIIVGTFTGDQPLPSTACLVEEALGCNGVPAFDLAAACSGFVYSLAVADAFIRSGPYERILAIGADMLTRVTNWTDRTTCVLFGDGAGAAVVAPVADDEGLLAFDLGTDCSGVRALRIEAGGSRMPCTPERLDAHMDKISMEGRDVFKFSVRIQGEATERALEKCGLTIADVDMVVPHQANIRIIEAAVERLGLPREKIYANIHKYGNTSAASVPIALDEAVNEGKIKKGDTVVVVGFGGGLTWAASVMKWVY